MDDIAIRIEKLGKRYRIGEALKYKALRDTLTDILGAPFRAVPSLLKRRRASSLPGRLSNNFIWALEDVSFEVKRGEAIGIIGRNGAGKTTLLKILSRITEPTEGFADMYGRVGTLLEIGTGFHPELTGRENIYLNGAILGMKKAEIERKFDKIVAFAEMERFIDTPVKLYSSGMYVRLAFAVAAHLEPEILLVDEVLAVGDVNFQKRCLGKMKDVAREGRTVLFVSHNLSSIVNLCQRAVLLDHGRIIADGRTGEAIQKYLSMAHSSEGEAIWPDPEKAPGNDIVRLRGVCILQDGIDGPARDVDISKEILIQITYSSLAEGALLYPAVQLKDKTDTLVLASSNGHSMSLTHDSWYGRPYPRGLFQSVCRIPANFLNDGFYRISVVLGKEPRTTIVLQEDVLSFCVHDTGEMRKVFFRGWGGVVRPRLAWNTEQIG